MGDRGQILIKDFGIYFYSHWKGFELRKFVQNALKIKRRWDDKEYLSRIIFCEMIKDNVSSEKGFGIGDVKHSDLNNPLLIVDIANQKISEEQGEYSDGVLLIEMSFDEFIKVEFDGED